MIPFYPSLSCDPVGLFPSFAILNTYLGGETIEAFGVYLSAAVVADELINC